MRKGIRSYLKGFFPELAGGSAYTKWTTFFTWKEVIKRHERRECKIISLGKNRNKYVEESKGLLVLAGGDFKKIGRIYKATK